MAKNVDIVYIDFAKAFDKVDFGIVVYKLAQPGVQGHVGRWILNFHKHLTHRHPVAPGRPAILYGRAITAKPLH